MTTWAVRSVLQSAHRSQSALELSLIGLDRIVLVLLDVVPRRRQQLLEPDERGPGRRAKLA